jgi:hypothetical protein
MLPDIILCEKDLMFECFNLPFLFCSKLGTMVLDFNSESYSGSSDAESALFCSGAVFYSSSPS